jgi:hypothetical protein
LLRFGDALFGRAHGCLGALLRLRFSRRTRAGARRDHGVPLPPSARGARSGISTGCFMASPGRKTIAEMRTPARRKEQWPGGSPNGRRTEGRRATRGKSPPGAGGTGPMGSLRGPPVLRACTTRRVSAETACRRPQYEYQSRLQTTSLGLLLTPRWREPDSNPRSLVGTKMRDAAVGLFGGSQSAGRPGEAGRRASGFCGPPCRLDYLGDARDLA